MTCRNTQNITIRFPEIGFELQPYTVDFRKNRDQFDFLEAKFSKDVGEHLQQFTDTEDGALRQPRKVEVVMDGKVSHVLYYRPQWVTYGQTNCWIEFHDALKHLEYTDFDFKMLDFTVEEAYKEVYDQANGDKIMNGIEFHIPEAATTTVERDFGLGGTYIGDFEAKTVIKGMNLVLDYDEEIPLTKQKSIRTADIKVDWQGKNCLEVLYTMNKELGLRSWVNNEGTLLVGLDFNESVKHVAAADDERVWKYNNAEVIPPGQPIEKAVVNGGSIDTTNYEGPVEKVSETLHTNWDEDLIPQGVATQPNVSNGKTVAVDAPNLARTHLEDRAKQVLLNEITNNNAGKIDINPNKSSIEVSDWRDVQVGDFIEVIPSDAEDCITDHGIERDVYLISGVKHEVDAGSWDIRLDVLKWAVFEPPSNFRYWSPDEDTYFQGTDDYKIGDKL